MKNSNPNPQKTQNDATNLSGNVQTAVSSTMPNDGQGSYWGSLWMVVAAICFTVMGVLIKMSSVHFAMHEYELSFWRMSFATMVLGVHAWLTHKDFRTAYPKEHFGRSVVGGVSVMMFFYGITHLPLATAITFNYTSTIFLAILSVLILKQYPKPLTWFALAVGFAGIVLLLKPSVANNGVLPTMIGLTAGAMAGYAYLQVRELSLLGEPAWRIVFYFSLVAAVLSAVATTIKGWTTLDVQMIPYVVGIGASALVAQLAMTHAYKVGRKFMVASLGYTTVVLSALYGVFVLQEVLDLWSMVGIVMIVASGILSGLKN